jgi:chemotaxis protein MotA
MLDMAVVVRRKGPLVLQTLEQAMSRQRFMREAFELVMDGVTPDEIERVLVQDMEAYAARYEHSINMLRRAAEVAPAMGLIGTLVGLVQMLATLEDPSSIGPSMAVALLTTFYGAILGTVFLAPLAAKLEKRMKDEFVERSMVLLTAMSMARKENPRRLEMLINTTLPPESRVRYFSEAGAKTQ